MSSKRVTVRLDRKHSAMLALGKPVTVKVPEGAAEMTIQCSIVAVPMPETSFSLAEIMDVFFNGRAARA